MEFTINNCPAYANNYEFIVVRLIDGEYWFWGAYANGYKAQIAACEVDGFIVHNVRIQGYNP